MSDEKSEAMATIQCTAGAAPQRKRDGSARKGGKDADVEAYNLLARLCTRYFPLEHCFFQTLPSQRCPRKETSRSELRTYTR